MGRLANTLLGLCTLFGTVACDFADPGNHDSITDLQTPESLQSDDLGRRWIAGILDSMQGRTGTYLKDRATQHGVAVGFAANLDHRIGEFNPGTNKVTLEVPLGLSEETFDELVLTGRRVMYEELDHAVRHHETDKPSGLHAEDHVDGVHTGNEAIARITAFTGMAEDAQIGSAPPLSVQFGIPESGHAVYYSVFNPEMADTIFAQLGEDEHLHERPDILRDAYTAFYGTSESEWYVLYYASHVLSDEDLAKYRASAPLSAVLRDQGPGRGVTFDDLAGFTALPDTAAAFLDDSMRQHFTDGTFTAEAETVSVRDLVRFKDRLSRPDNGPANHLARTASGGGDLFRDGTKGEIVEALESQLHNMEIIQGFFQRCATAHYIPEPLRTAMSEMIEQAINPSLETFRPATAQMIGTIQGKTGDLTLEDRLAIKTYYNEFHAILYPLSAQRVDIHERFVADQDRQCTFKNLWP